SYFLWKFVVKKLHRFLSVPLSKINIFYEVKGKMSEGLELSPFVSFSKRKLNLNTIEYNIGV
ncbi:MAG: hypothetical protein KC516_04765, partial [Nanoarchaeota archaeon]|nr:hypothetical protein [Nanoarchaeota archaeon]